MNDSNESVYVSHPPPGETVTITVNDGKLVEGVTCFNLKNTADKVAPTVPENIKIGNVAFDQAAVSWDPSTDEGDGKATEYFAQDGERSILLKGLTEVTKYSVTVEAVDNGGNRSGASAAKSFTTLPDRSRPALNPIW